MGPLKCDHNKDSNGGQFKERKTEPNDVWLLA